MANAGTVQFGKVILKNSSKMSLNARFQMLRQSVQKVQLNPTNAVNRRINARQLKQGSAKNRRLALQMANRPAVIAALRPLNNNNNKGSIKQRLGPNRGRILGRINTANVANAVNIRRVNRRPFNRSGFAQAQARIGRQTNNNNNNNNLVMNRRGANARNRAQNTMKQRNRFGPKQNRGRKMATGVTNAVMGQRKGFRKPKRNAGQMQGQVQIQGNRQNQRFRINRNFNARNARNNARPQQQRQRRQRNVQLNRQDLDKDLDTYMARTKSHLDADLDAYMSQA